MMKEILTKMSELKLEAPLAQFEETDDWQQSELRLKTDEMTAAPKDSPKKMLVNMMEMEKHEIVELETEKEEKFADFVCHSVNGGHVDNFDEAVSGSLEDLVNTFDEKITRCFHNYQESVEKLAPVQVRTQEEIMNECQMWWTITGNFGNILPIDWSKSYSRKVHMPALNLKQQKEEYNRSNSAVKGVPEASSGGTELESEDEAVANDLDMHSLILSGLTMDNEPVKTADEVIREIDDIIEGSTEAETAESDLSPDGGKDNALKSPYFQTKLKTLTTSQLNELYLEMELLIKEYSETLISELALRDELEYEKELKNTFISLLLGVQNRRRHYHVEKKKGIRNAMMAGPEPKYLTTVIPYHVDIGPLDNHALQVLIKILKAINEDSPTVPTLLTDYILKVLCPT